MNLLPVITAPTIPEIVHLPCLSSSSLFCNSNDIAIGEVVRQLLYQGDTGRLKTSVYSTGRYFYVVVFQHISFKLDVLIVLSIFQFFPRCAESCRIAL